MEDSARPSAPQPQPHEIPVYEIDLGGDKLTEQDLRRVLARVYANRPGQWATIVIKRISTTAIPAVFLTY